MRNAYAEKVGFVADLAYKTRRLIEESATQDGLGRLTKSVTFDVKTLEALRGEKGSDEGKVFNLVRGLQKEIDDDADAAPVLQPLKDRAERILKDLENRKTTGLAAMDLLAALAAEKEAASEAAKETGLSPKAFAVFWAPSGERDTEDQRDRRARTGQRNRKAPGPVPQCDGQSRRADGSCALSLYRPLMGLPKDARAGVVDLIMANLLG